MEAFMNTNHSLVAALLLPRPNKSLVTFARAVHEHLTDNPKLPSPTPTLTLFAADINALDEAETTALTRARGAATARDAKRKKLKEDLAHLRDYVQSVVEAQANSRDAATLIESAFMSVRKPGKRSRAELRARNTGVSGTVVLDAKAVAPVATYYWQYSPDQQTWTSAPDTMKVSRVISGLTSAKTYYFRFRALTKAGEIGFSQVVSLLVH
jgi:hypothetical protein